MTNGDSPVLEWKVSLSAEFSGKRYTILLLGLGLGVFAWFRLGSPLLAILGPVIFFVAIGEVFFPIKYRLDSQGASARCGLSVTQIEWSRVKQIYEQEDGVKLSPFENPHRMNAFRGLYLRFSSNRDEVLATIRSLWGNDAALARESDG